MLIKKYSLFRGNRFPRSAGQIRIIPRDICKTGVTCCNSNLYCEIIVTYIFIYIYISLSVLLPSYNESKCFARDSIYCLEISRKPRSTILSTRLLRSYIRIRLNRDEGILQYPRVAVCYVNTNYRLPIRAWYFRGCRR